MVMGQNMENSQSIENHSNLVASIKKEIDNMGNSLKKTFSRTRHICIVQIT